MSDVRINAHKETVDPYLLSLNPAFREIIVSNLTSLGTPHIFHPSSQIK